MRFRKQICLFLAFSLLVSNIGFALNVHYCGDEIASISLKSYANPEKRCCGATAEKKSSCCKDKVILVEKKSDNATIKYFSFQFDYNFRIEDFQAFNFTSPASFNKTAVNAYYCDAHAPPLFKLYSQYIFYA